MNIAKLGIILLFFGFFLQRCTTTKTQQEQKIVQSSDTVYTFEGDILPLLQSNCNPCHFPGGQVYEKLPFDNDQTIISLGKKLTTRLKQKNQQAIINSWIESRQRKSSALISDSTDN